MTAEERLDSIDARLDRLLRLLETFADLQDRMIANVRDSNRNARDLIALVSGPLDRLADAAGWDHCPSCGRCHRCHQPHPQHEGEPT